MNRRQTFVRIILPQLVPLILPGAGNQLIWSLLNTSLGMVVGLQELTGATYTAQSLTQLVRVFHCYRNHLLRARQVGDADALRGRSAVRRKTEAQA